MIGDDEFESLDGTPETDEDGGEVLIEGPPEAVDPNLPEVVEIEDEGDEFEDLEAEIPGDGDDLLDIDNPDDDDDDDDEDPPVTEADLDDELESALRGGDGEGDDLSDIKSPKIRDRIMRERRKAGEAVENATRIEATMRDVRTKTWDTLHGVHSRRIAEVSAMGQSVIDAADQVLELNRERIKQARESGNSDIEFAAQDAIATWTKIKDQVSPMLEKAKSEKVKVDEWRKTRDPNAALVEGGPQQQPQQQSQDEDTVPPMAREWVEKNPWFTEQRHEDARSFAQGVERALLRGGKYQTDNPRLYELIARGIAKRFPEISVMDLNGKRVAGTTEKEVRRRRPRRRGEEGVSNKSGTPSGRRSNSRSLKVTKVEAAKMRNFQLDPSNPSHVKEWRANATPPPRSRRRESSRQVV